MKAGIVRTLVIALGMAVFIVLFLRPQASLSPLDQVLLIMAIEVAAIVTARWIAPSGHKNYFVKALISAFAFSALIVFVLKPAMSLSFDVVFLVILVIQYGAFLIGSKMTDTIKVVE